MRLLGFNTDGKVTISAEAMTLLPFKAIWDRDKSKNKNTAIKELSFIFFECDTRSTYLSESNDTERRKNIAEDVGLGSNFKMDDLMQRACAFYKSRKSSAEVLVDGLREVSINLKNFLVKESKNPSDSEVPLEKLASTTLTLSKNITELDQKELQVGKMLEESNVRGGKEGFSYFEGGIDAAGRK